MSAELVLVSVFVQILIVIQDGDVNWVSVILLLDIVLMILVVLQAKNVSTMSAITLLFHQLPHHHHQLSILNLQNQNPNQSPMITTGTMDTGTTKITATTGVTTGVTTGATTGATTTGVASGATKNTTEVD